MLMVYLVNGFLPMGPDNDIIPLFGNNLGDRRAPGTGP
jgi:hypothetical protein